MHLEFLVEEPSMEAFLRSLLPRLLAEGPSYDIHAYQGKADLLQRLPDRLRGYAQWLPADWRIIVLVDRDDDDCVSLRQRMDEVATAAGLRTRSAADPRPWQVVNRLAIEELEAWYFAAWRAVCAAFPRLPSTIPQNAAYRDADAIRGGTWEAFERVLRKHGYFKTGLRKLEGARSIGAVFDATACHSHSFRKLYDAIVETTSLTDPRAGLRIGDPRQPPARA